MSAVDELRAALEAWVRELAADEVARQLADREQAVGRWETGSRGDGSPWRSRDEAAAYLGVSVRTLDRMIKRGSVRSEPIGRRRLFHCDDLDALARGRGGERGVSANPLHPAAAGA
jgi:excisionase family DNA binding protein